MKRLIILTITLLLLTSCGISNDNDTQSGTEKQTVYIDFTSAQSYSDMGVTYVSDSGILHFYDLASGYDTALCSKANCKHEGVSAANPKPTCDGYVEGSCYSPAIYCDNLYFLYTPDKKESSYADLSTKVLCKADKDGTNRSEIAKLDNAQTISASAYSGHYYACAYYNSFDDNGQSFDKRVCKLSVIDLDSGSICTTPSYENTQGIINKICFDGESAVFAYTYTTEDIDLSKQNDSDYDDYLKGIIKTELIRFNFAGGEAKNICTLDASITDIGFGYALTDEDETSLISLSDGSRKSLDSGYLPYLMTDKGVLVYGKDDNSLALYDISSGKTTKLGIKDKNTSVAAITDSYVYMYYSVGKDTFLGYVERSVLLSGKECELTKIKAV